MTGFRKRILLIVKCAIFACVLSGTKHTFAAEPIDFSIDSQRADVALTEFAKQAGITLLFPYDEAEQITTPSLQGNFSPYEGLMRLLAGTPLAAKLDDNGLLSVQLVREPELAESSESLGEPSYLQQSDNEFVIEQIAVVGTRSAPRSIVTSPVPVDIISGNQFLRQGNTDIISMLTTLVPSLNVNDQSINDAASLVRPANLRGMASDHTLILLNGKRRHRSAAITFLGGGLSDGAQGPDISVIPSSALKQVEILRDGAAAQYGSDAIAGVINFVLKDDDSGGNISTQLGQFYSGGGEEIQLQGNIGTKLTNKGFLNISAEFRQREATDRAVQRDDAQALVDAGNTFVNDPAQDWGILDVDNDIKFLANMGGELSGNVRWYSFINFAQRDIEGGFYYRHPQQRRGVFLAESSNGQSNRLLVGDLDGIGSGIECPTVIIDSDNILNNEQYIAIADNTTEVGLNCFAFNERFPGGFSPRFGGRVKDASFNAGFKGVTPTEWYYDMSVGLGYSDIDYKLLNTVNPSLGPNSPTSFSPGGVSQVERSINIDVKRYFDSMWVEPISVAAGLEWRRESYHQQAGELASYQVGFLAVEPATGIEQGFSVGSNGFPGYTPQSAGHWSRSNWAIYTDIESYVAENIQVGTALRYEHFNDFGSTFEGKLTGRFEVSEQLSFRGSISTGFKAPTVGQSNVINVTTAFSSRGLEDQATLPPTHPISQQVGATPLKPEESVNSSLGLVYYWDESLYLTFDYFNIELSDRISTTSAIRLSEQDKQALLAQGLSNTQIFDNAKYFTNDFDTSTHGVDVVLNHHFALWGINHHFSASLNWTETQVERVTLYTRANAEGEIVTESNLTPARIRMLEDNLPNYRAVLSLAQRYEQFSALWRLRYYSSFYEDHLDASADLDIYGSSETVLDVELGYDITESLSFTLGVQNAFDATGSENPFRGTAGALYPPTSPIGMNGGYYYARINYSFE